MRGSYSIPPRGLNIDPVTSERLLHKRPFKKPSMRDCTAYLTAAGFKRSQSEIAQAHDPTKNLLVEFVKA